MVSPGNKHIALSGPGMCAGKALGYECLVANMALHPRRGPGWIGFGCGCIVSRMRFGRCLMRFLLCLGPMLIQVDVGSKL